MGTPLVNTNNITIEACNILFGLRKVFTITAVADVDGSLNNKSFTVSCFNEIFQETTYTFTMVTATASPVLLNNTVTISVPSGSTANAVAALLVTALELIDIRSAIAVENIVTCTLEYFGNATAPDAGTSTFTVAETVAGSGGYIGSTQDGITLNFEKSLVPIEIDQTGAQIQDEILTGVSCTVDTTLLELSLANMSNLIGSTWGGEKTPAGGTKVVGVGTSKNFLNMLQYAKELILKPLNANDDNFTTSHFFWKAFPDLSSLNMSGTELKNAPVSFKCYRDPSKAEEVSVYCYGDGTQEL